MRKKEGRWEDREIAVARWGGSVAEKSNLSLYLTVNSNVSYFFMPSIASRTVLSREFNPHFSFPSLPTSTQIQEIEFLDSPPTPLYRHHHCSNPNSSLLLLGYARWGPHFNIFSYSSGIFFSYLHSLLIVFSWNILFIYFFFVVQVAA